MRVGQDDISELTRVHSLSSSSSESVYLDLKLVHSSDLVGRMGNLIYDGLRSD